MEELKVHVHTVDGIPAKDYGEWPGITSNHWKGSIKVLRPIRKEKIFEGRNPNKERFGVAYCREEAFSNSSF
jgi:hypothetical protein